MFSWLGDILAGLGEAISVIFESEAAAIVETIWNSMIQWAYTAIYTAVADLFTEMNGMGAEIFNLSWVQALVHLFTLFGWAMFISGIAVTALDIAVESQSRSVDLKRVALNVFKGFFACSLLGVLPVELYRFCISLQGGLSRELAVLFAGAQGTSLGEIAHHVVVSTLFISEPTQLALRLLFFLLAFSYCVIKVFFDNIKRGGILLIQIGVGSLYMFSVPRGFTDGFNQWCKQVIALCLTAFLQTTLLFVGMMTFSGDMLMGIGIMLAAGEVPRIAQQFGLDSSLRLNLGGIIHTTTMMVNITRTFAKT